MTMIRVNQYMRDDNCNIDMRCRFLVVWGVGSIARVGVVLGVGLLV